MLRPARAASDSPSASQPFCVGTAERELLSREGVRNLFAVAAIEKAWGGYLLYRAINLTAVATGCRLGELLALRDADVHDEGRFPIAHSWHAHYGLLPTKTRQERDVPVPPRVLDRRQTPQPSTPLAIAGSRSSRLPASELRKRGLFLCLTSFVSSRGTSL